MKNLVSRYYLTRELVKLQQMRDELFQAMCLAEQNPTLQRHSKATRKFFLAKAEQISFGIEFLTNMLNKLAGDGA